MKLTKYYYKDIFNRAVPASFTEVEKSEFLQFCQEYCAVVSGHGRFEKGRFFYYFGESSKGKGIEVPSNMTYKEWKEIYKIK
mgnify:CR=1 FL=1